MKLCITEKPSVARDIAAILGANVRRDGFYEGGDYKVTWTFGHLCTLKEPADYTPLWKRWALGQLPMIPDKFSIKLISDAGIEKQFRVIESLIAEADEVINCGDAGQEGELIQRWVMQKAGIKCPVKRLWISSLTDESIRQGFRDLKPEADFNPLYHAGLSRAIGDWILGMNATRLYTLKYAGNSGAVLSIGRVQTPTLALIVQRHKEIEQFKSEDFWEIKTTYRDTLFNGRLPRIKSEDEGKAIIEAISDKPLTIIDIEEKQGRESPPRLFDLTSLQVECNKKWGWTADETLSLIQSLYEKKVTTYPRVDTTYLSTDLYPKIPEILGKMTPYANFTASVLAQPITKTKRIFDNAKVTDHHAIIPTGESPAALVGKERHLYHLIATRFIAAFYPDCLFMQTTVNAAVKGTAGVAGDSDVEFRVTGKVITSDGWRAVFSPARDESDAKDKDAADESEGILPAFTVGESGAHQPSLLKRATQPPKYYTEGTLLRAMESAGKTVDDEQLREAMKENGIGRPSTRSAIIETLFKRRYIYRQRKSIMASAAGIQLIDTINQELLKSAKLTGIWENKLRRIERGEYSASEFIAELKQQISEIVINVLSDNTSARIQVDTADDKKRRSSKASSADAPAKKRAPATKSFDQIVCPKCGKGHIIKGRTAFGCSEYASGCALRLPFEQYPADLTPAKLKKLIAKL
ncbi:MAG: DNA topoisomerase 3 [Muribaculaceae bacterium]|nr:DNA topoisomerase 3 [Muribaculaceae bacterium]